MERNNRQTGSAMPGEPVYLAVGRLRKPHGVMGEIVFEVITDFPERLSAEKALYCGETYAPLKFRNVRPFGNLFLVSIEGVADRDQAGLFRNQYVYVKTEDVPPLPEGEYYHHQLIGLSVEDESANKLGRLVEILETGANDVYVILTPEDEEMLIPAIPSAILGVNLGDGVIKIRPPEWE